jgi:hypothetical protein
VPAVNTVTLFEPTVEVVEVRPPPIVRVLFAGYFMITTPEPPAVPFDAPTPD